MDRRTFLIGAGSAAGVVLLPRLANAEPNRIDWYTGSDTNILDFWSNIVKPRFEAANPGITLNLVDGGDGAGLEAIAERALGGDEDQHRSACRHVRGIRSAPAQGFDRSGPLDRLLQGGAHELRQDQPDHARHRLQHAVARLAGADRLRLDQAQARRRAPQLGRPRRLDQGQSRAVHLLPSGQGRLRQQFHPACRLSGERPRSRASSRSTTSPRKRPRRCSTRPGSFSRTSVPTPSARAPTPRATPSPSSSCRRTP